MHQLPPIPGWSDLHPLMTHFPLVLFILLPGLFILAGLYRSNRNHAFWAASLMTMLAGLGLMGVTFFSGAAFARTANADPAIAARLSYHCTLAQYTITAFAIAAILLAIALAVRRSLKLEDMRDLTPWLPIGFFAFYGLGVFWLVLTAHEGAMLAHEILPKAAVR